MNWSTTTKRPGAQLLAQRADRRDGDQIGAARALQRVDIGAGVDLARRDAVAAAVAGQEDEADAVRAGRSARRRTARPQGVSTAIHCASSSASIA